MQLHSRSTTLGVNHTTMNVKLPRRPRWLTPLPQKNLNLAACKPTHQQMAFLVWRQAKIQVLVSVLGNTPRLLTRMRSHRLQPAVELTLLASEVKRSMVLKHLQMPQIANLLLTFASTQWKRSNP